MYSLRIQIKPSIQVLTRAKHKGGGGLKYRAFTSPSLAGVKMDINEISFVLRPMNADAAVRSVLCARAHVYYEVLESRFGRYTGMNWRLE